MRFLAILLMTLIFWTTNGLAKMDFAAEINVDVTAENAVQAKEQAMRQAQREAFIEVVSKLTDAENVAKLQELTDDEIVHFVRSVGVGDEKTGGNKYVAVLTVQLDEALLRDYLAENDMIEAETAELLVIPVFKPVESYNPLLWENDNLWRQSWLAKGMIKFGTMQIRTIGERFRDVKNLTADTTLYMDSRLYEAVSEMNGSDKIYVVYAQTMSNGDFKVVVKDLKNKEEDSFTVYNDENDNIFDKAIEKSVMFISNMERNARYMERPTTTGTINAVYMYENMKDWLSKSTAMDALPMVEGIDTKSFGGGKVNFTIRYTGSLEDLWQAFQELGLSHETIDNYFIIR